MNVYDFDGTIYDGDSTIDFYFFCLKKRKKVLLSVPTQLKGAFFYLLKRYDKTKFKECFYAFLKRLPDTDSLVEEFWKRNLGKIKEWYLQQQCEDDVVISASPHFLLAPVCAEKKIGALIASQVDKRTGLYTGPNCRGQEKVNRFRQQYGDAEIDCFYSDNQSDDPMAALAKKSFLVKGDTINEWRF